MRQRYTAAMVRPDGSTRVRRSRAIGGPSCVGLAGGSPAAVSAVAPRSRPQATGEIPASERGVKCPSVGVCLHDGEQSRRPNIK